MAFSSYTFLLLLLSLFTPAFCFRHPDAVIDVRHQTPPSLHHHLASVLSSLGYQQLAAAVSSISEPSFFSPWDHSATVFAPSDGLVDASTFLINEHIVPGVFTLSILSRMKSGTLLGTLSPGRCLALLQDNDTAVTILVNSVPIVKPDMYNDGELVVHGIGSPFSPLSPFSCGYPIAATTATTSAAASTSTTDFPVTVDPYVDPSAAFLMSLMLRDAMRRLRERGYSIVALALRVKYPELVALHNMTIFALDDSAIFSGSHAYVSNFRFHVVPNRLLTHDDLVALPLGSVLPTLAKGECLLVTSAGASVRINYVSLSFQDVMRNLNIVVHGIFLPFPHLLQEFSVESTFDDSAVLSPAPAPDVDEPCCTAGQTARRSVLYDGQSMAVSSEDDIF